ncbi:MAG: LysR family transcriptional regulator [Oscillospiraceae bacterium]|nr:LysR family transcriptional regulator [Oscillospiraceae bacterium]
MNTIQLECFVAVAEFLNFTKAAEALKITQPAVSHQINSLEDELGTKLFVRNKKKVHLTKAGMQFIGDATSILGIEVSDKARLNDNEEASRLSLAIGCHNQLELNILPPILRRLRAEFPQLRPNIKLIPAEAMENLLEDESIQVMLSMRDGVLNSGIGTYRELLKCQVACICAPDHPFASYAVLEEEQLTGNLVLCEPRRAPDSVFKVQSHAAHMRPSAQNFFCGGYENVIALVRAGVGFTLMPDVPAAREHALCYVPVTGFDAISLGIVYKSIRGNPVLRRFVEIAQMCVGEGNPLCK